MAFEDWINKPGIIANEYDDSITGFGADLNNGGASAYLVGNYQVYNNTASYALQIQVSSNNVDWDDSSADPLSLTSEDETSFVIQFDRTVRYARASLNVVDGPGQILLGCTFVTPEVDSTEIAPVELVYDPVAPAPSELQQVRIYCGSGMNIKFSPTTPTAIAAAENWEVRVGQLYSSASEPPTILSYKVNTGNLTVDVDTGDIVADLAANETEDLDPSPSVRTFVELWRIGVGDDNTGPVARAIAKVIDTVRPAP